MHQRSFRKSLAVLGILMWLVGCAPEATLPTPVPTAVVMTTATPAPTLPPTMVPPTQPAATNTPEPTEVVSTPTPIFSPTPVIGPLVNIEKPLEGQLAVMGSELLVSGFAQISQGMSIKVGLTSAAGMMLATGDAEVDISEWEGALTIPEYVTGLGQVQAVILDAGGNEVARDSVEITITGDRQNNDSYVTLIRPEAHSIGVAGHNFYMDGQLWRQGGGNLQVAVFMDDCQDNVADVFFQLNTSSYWQGYVILPRDIEGPACATAWVGTPGEPGWRAAQVPVTILHQDDPLATGVMVSNPREGRNLQAGETILVTGVAYNIAGRIVNIEILLENGQVVAEAEDAADYYGYWSAEVTLPVGIEGDAIARVTTGDRAQPDSQTEVSFNIVAP